MAIGGDGNGGNEFSGGGGGGGVVIQTVVLPIGSDTINISVGAGQTRGLRQFATGETTNVSFIKSTALNLIAGGGGNGQQYSLAGVNGSINGGSGAGGSLGNGAGGSANNSNNNLANVGGIGTSDSRGEGGSQGGGGGSGTRGDNAPIKYGEPQANGGNGVQCNLTGIRMFGQYGSYYWASGGGGGNGTGFGGNSGLGGGGGGHSGSTQLQVPPSVEFRNGLGDINALNRGSDGTFNNGGDAGLNTGSGGGGGGQGSLSGGAGGSGIVIVAFK